MAVVNKAGAGEGGWIQVAPDSWKWDPSITWKQDEKHWYLHWPKGFKEEKKLEQTFEQANERRVAKLAEQGRKPNGRLAVGTKIQFVQYPEKGARQMMQILDLLQDFEGGTTIGMLWEKLEGVLNTKQPVDRVYKHYHREMVDKGYIRILS